MDLIEHRINGYLAEPFNIDDMAMGIRWIMEDGERHRDYVGVAEKRRYENSMLESRPVVIFPSSGYCTPMQDRLPGMVSIITPSYNQGTFIRETIESVLRPRGGFPSRLHRRGWRFDRRPR